MADDFLTDDALSTKKSTDSVRLYCYNGTDFVRIEADALTNHLIVISHFHEEIHDGNHYNVSHLFTAVADDGFALLRITTGSTMELHFTFEVDSESKILIDVLEGTTYSGDGTAVTAFNNRRSSANTTDATIRHTPTIDAAGTIIDQHMAGAAGGTPAATAIGGVGGNQNEWVFKIDAEYLIRVQNKDGTNTKDIVINAFYYEEAP